MTGNLLAFPVVAGAPLLDVVLSGSGTFTVNLEEFGPPDNVLLDAVDYTFTGIAGIVEVPEPVTVLAAFPALALLAAAALWRARSAP